MGIDEISIPTTEIEADGFITPPSALEHTEHANTACTGNATAQPMRECPYPKCEECDKYHGHYCTVPMVVSKQIYLLTAEKLRYMEMRLDEMENLITEEIFGSAVRSYTLFDEPRKNPPPIEITPCDDTNLTWSDYFKENSR